MSTVVNFSNDDPPAKRVQQAKVDLHLRDDSTREDISPIRFLSSDLAMRSDMVGKRLGTKGGKIREGGE